MLIASCEADAESVGQASANGRLRRAAFGRRLLLPLSIIVWCVVLACGIAAAWRFDAVPGPVSQHTGGFPAGDLLARTPGVPILVLILHPQCPCSRASLGELEILLASQSQPLQTFVVLTELPGMTDAAQSELWKKANMVPGVTVVRDPAARIAARFDARTSGEVFLYDADGAIQFAGGITASRGHAGGNDGRFAIDAILSGRTPATKHTPVFGCALQ